MTAAINVPLSQELYSELSLKKKTKQNKKKKKKKRMLCLRINNNNNNNTYIALIRMGSKRFTSIVLRYDLEI